MIDAEEFGGGKYIQAFINVVVRTITLVRTCG
jgi:hypothetical protein